MASVSASSVMRARVPQDAAGSRGPADPRRFREHRAVPTSRLPCAGSRRRRGSRESGGRSALSGSSGGIGGAGKCGRTAFRPFAVSSHPGRSSLSECKYPAPYSVSQSSFMRAQLMPCSSPHASKSPGSPSVSLDPP